MAEMSVIWLRVAAALYSLGLLHAILTLVRRREHLFRVALGAFGLASVFHFVSIVEEGIVSNRCPINNFYETLSMCAFLLVVLYLFAHWRFKLEPTTVRWDDLVRGESHIDCASLSDPVLRREDGTYLYTLPSVVDDVEFGVTHVIRGEDHVTNTAVQIQIFEALAGAAPGFGHHNLLTDAGGEGLSKRTGALSIASLREKGVEALAVAALAVLVGSAEPVRPVATLDELAKLVELKHLSHGAARFDEAELDALSARILHQTPYASVTDKLAALGIAGPNAEAFWNAVRGNLSRLSDATIWRRVVEGDVTPVVEDRAYLDLAASRLPEGAWDGSTWGAWTNDLKALTGRKGRELYHPLRLALTGRDAGPELAALLPLIGRARALGRLSAPSG